MRYAFIEAEKADYPVTVMCHVLEVSRSGYYAWRGWEPSTRQRQDEVILEAIRESHARSNKAYGSPRITHDLRADGRRISEKRVARLMRENQIEGKRKRRFRVTTQADGQPTAENLLERDFQATEPNRKWVTDITFIRTLEGWLYLAVVLDLYSRRVVGWSMNRWISQNLVVDALQMAVGRRQVEPGLMVHSDRGRQYTSLAFQRLLKKMKARCSMSRKGDCWDNAVAESFFSSLKRELDCEKGFFDRAQARAELFDYIEVFYNRQRRHSSLGYLSPSDFEEAARIRSAA